MSSKLALVAYLVDEYDHAIEWFTTMLGFQLVEDEPREAGKRWVVVRPPGGGTALLLARAANAAQRDTLGRQAGGRVFLFLQSRDFWSDYQAMVARGVTFCEAPREEPYGMVVVFEDCYGQRWDLLGPAPE